MGPCIVCVPCKTSKTTLQCFFNEETKVWLYSNGNFDLQGRNMLIAHHKAPNFGFKKQLYEKANRSHLAKCRSDTNIQSRANYMSLGAAARSDINLKRLTKK